MSEITLEELLEAGCHFGHQVTRSNPKARDFIFEARDGIHIIDLAKTKEGLEEAISYVRNLAANPAATLLIVGTKRQARPVVVDNIKKAKEADASEGLYFVTEHWIGGFLTNFSEVSRNFKKLETLTRNLSSDEEKSKFTKKEVGDWEKEKKKLEILYGGIKDVKKSPDAIFVVDARLEELAIKEANKTGVTTVAIVDTNADPNAVDYPIPANDDAVGSIGLIVGFIMDAWIEGRLKGQKAKEKTEKKEETKKLSKTKSASGGEKKNEKNS
ncbi:MAG: hypothetical protein ACD_37C00585G0003 [uncultured bacterium]|nr:MAG: hypothetical protein ACD_37C00585G0003 [uncultured bacterium]KKP95906.1 MAG: 30S ribosomal protein S2 [Candidatus Levybacteria bacterium GW2011_GWA2_36_13]KKQ57929.1 MAG: ribosomal protein S2, small subunit ribosomal protein S2 [Microgenomates group bacterium GW2011_GWC1_38_14]KKR15740.1 MAG: 30S ribosomal protein S2 [Candidatus Levybacteria bacterium GW2011_GWA1_39_34]